MHKDFGHCRSFSWGNRFLMLRSVIIFFDDLDEEDLWGWSKRRNVFHPLTDFK